MIDLMGFSEEIVKIAQDKRERVRNAVGNSLAAGLGTAGGIAAADLLASQIERRYPHLTPALRSKAMRYGVPGLLAGVSGYASQKYKKNVNDAVQMALDNDK